MGDEFSDTLIVAVLGHWEVAVDCIFDWTDVQVDEGVDLWLEAVDCTCLFDDAIRFVWDWKGFIFEKSRVVRVAAFAELLDAFGACEPRDCGVADLARFSPPLLREFVRVSLRSRFPSFELHGPGENGFDFGSEFRILCWCCRGGRSDVSGPSPNGLVFASGALAGVGVSDGSAEPIGLSITPDRAESFSSNVSGALGAMGISVSSIGGASGCTCSGSGSTLYVGICFKTSLIGAAGSGVWDPSETDSWIEGSVFGSAFSAAEAPSNKPPTKRDDSFMSAASGKFMLKSVTAERRLHHSWMRLTSTFGYVALRFVVN